MVQAGTIQPPGEFQFLGGRKHSCETGDRGKIDPLQARSVGANDQLNVRWIGSAAQPELEFCRTSATI
jgi:hypothetical protein